MTRMIRNMKYRMIDLFEGIGGIRIAFEENGAKCVKSSEIDKYACDTYEKNFHEMPLGDITKIKPEDLTDFDIITAGFPCQPFSLGGLRKGFEDTRGTLFFEVARLIKAKKPKAFFLENVEGIVNHDSGKTISVIENVLHDLDYNFQWRVMNASDYGTPQNRKRWYCVGFRKDLNIDYKFPEPLNYKITLKDAIWDLKDTAIKAQDKNKTNGNKCFIPNHEYMNGGFSTIYMSRNRVRNWDEQSFTIQAGGRHAPIHPQAPKMIFVEKNKRIFVPGKENLYRRLSVRECARIQTFPDDFIFYYTDIADGYKMVGNAVPVMLAYHVAKSIKAIN